MLFSQHVIVYAQWANNPLKRRKQTLLPYAIWSKLWIEITKKEKKKREKHMVKHIKRNGKKMWETKIGRECVCERKLYKCIKHDHDQPGASCNILSHDMNIFFLQYLYATYSVKNLYECVSRPSSAYVYWNLKRLHSFQITLTEKCYNHPHSPLH